VGVMMTSLSSPHYHKHPITMIVVGAGSLIQL